MKPVADLDLLRLRGIGILVVAAWTSTALLMAVGLTLHANHTMLVVLLAILLNAMPTLMAVQHRRDRTARLLVATLAAAHPAFAIYLLAGHPWQTDGHMYFFVALAALTVLCDWRPLVLASLLIIMHHVLLWWLVPAWVFNQSGDAGIVVLHGVAVAEQCAILGYVTVQLRALLQRQAADRDESEGLAADAIQGRREVEAAMAATHAAEQREGVERSRRETAERDTALERRREMLALATAFHASVADIVGAVGTASTELEDSAHALDRLARRASAESVSTASAAALSSDNARDLADRTQDLGISITAIAASVEQQAVLSGNARAASTSGHDAVGTLADRVTAISSFAESISEIAGRTNLLALNATIEAARAGDAGRGFAVVAGEVKLLAGQAAGATGQIRTLAGSAQGGADVANVALKDIARMVAALAEAAEEIRGAVDHQRATITMIESTAHDTAASAVQMSDLIRGVVEVASDTEILSGRVSIAAGGLTRTARDLQQATEHFVAKLRAG